MRVGFYMGALLGVVLAGCASNDGGEPQKDAAFLRDDAGQIVDGGSVATDALSLPDASVAVTDASLPDAELGLCAGKSDGRPCSDGNLCNGAETCQSGVCSSGLPLSCDDGNACTSDSCDSALGCVVANVDDGTSCADDTVCNGAETCQSGVCSSGLPLSCDDGNACTSDSCDSALGCVVANVDDGTSCGSGLSCRAPETCQIGVCSPSESASCWTMGGVVSGLSSAGLILQENADSISVNTDGYFEFTETYENGENYTVEIAAQPSNQRCVVQNHAGAVAGGDVRDIRVVCSSCGNGEIDDVQVTAIEFEWRTTHNVPNTDIEFYINDTLAHSEDGSTGSIYCAPARSIRVSDPSVLSLVSPGENAFRVVFPARIASAKARVFTTAATHDIVLVESGNYCGFYGSTNTSVDRTLTLSEECDDGGVSAGDGCSSTCQDETCSASSDADSDRLDDCAEIAAGTDKYIADTDGDGIDDGDEVLGTLDGLDLPSLGANPLRQDIFVEIDWAEDNSACGDVHSHQIPVEAADYAIAMFAGAPNINVDGSTGISLHLDYGQGGEFTGGNSIGSDTSISSLDSDFLAYKSAHFPSKREDIFHYAISIHSLDSGAGGVGEVGGDDFVISQGFCDVCVSGAPCSTQCVSCSGPFGFTLANTLAHELGHNLGLFHGGADSCNQKPNYPSIMNYRYVGGIDTGCDLVPDGVLDFSRGDRISLQETELDENRGICGGSTSPIDWNGGGISSSVAANINSYSGESSQCGGTQTLLQDSDDWQQISYVPIAQGESDGLLDETSLLSIAVDSCFDHPEAKLQREEAERVALGIAGKTQNMPSPSSTSSDGAQRGGCTLSSGARTNPLWWLIFLGGLYLRRPKLGVRLD